MKTTATRWGLLVLLCLLSSSILSCRRQNAEDAPPFHIIATDAGFEAPKGVAAGLRHIVFENRGSDIHEGMFVKLPTGMTAEEYVAAVRNGSLFPAGALDYSGPGLTSPGEKIELWLTLDPGNYIIICWNFGHSKTTPVHPFRVEQVGARDHRPPKEDVVLKLADYRFELAGKLRSGLQTIRVETPGPAMHEVDFFHLHEGRTVEELKRWRKEGVPGHAPALAVGGVLDSHDLSRVVWLRRMFTPGRYVLHCEMPVTNTEMTHADAGMVQEIEIAD